MFCGPSMVFTNVINPRSDVSRKDEYLDTLVKRGATLGANCTIVCGVTIGEHAFVGAGSVVTRDVAPYALVMGVPARQVGWMSPFGERLDLPLTGEGRTVCPHTGVDWDPAHGRAAVGHGGVNRLVTVNGLRAGASPGWRGGKADRLERPVPGIFGVIERPSESRASRKKLQAS